MMTLGKEGTALLHSFEKCRLEAYPDPGSKDGNPWTVGWGHTGPEVVKGYRISQKTADYYFTKDVEKFVKVVRECTAGTPIKQNEFDAFVCFTYNCGADSFRESTLLKKFKAGDKTGAVAEFARWNKNDGKVMPGLIRRRKAEARLFLGEPWDV